jgi:hypothetical protein
MGPLCLGGLYRDFTTEEIGEQNKEEGNKSPDIDETPSEMWKFFVQLRYRRLLKHDPVQWNQLCVPQKESVIHPS